MDVSQLILVGVIFLLTLLLLFLGFQVFLVLRDVRQTLKRANRIVDELGASLTIEVLKLAFGKQKGKKIISDLAENPGVYARDEGVKSGNKREAKIGLADVSGGFSESDVNLKENTPRFSTGKFIDRTEDVVQGPSGNGETNGEETVTPLALQLKPPRFFKGIPKRR